MPPDDERDYEVGYGKPPRHTRFQPGRSGNPRGRPSGSKNLTTLLGEVLNVCASLDPVGRGGREEVIRKQSLG